MYIDKFFNKIIEDFGEISWYGVPDSKLKSVCNYLVDKYGIGRKHVIVANEGNAVAMAAGHYLATGKPALVYMQNSGLGNIVNPVESLLRIYEIPCILVIGWRGEPNIHDEPQHFYQGQDTLATLDVLSIPYMILEECTSEQDFFDKWDQFKDMISSGKSVAFVVRQNGLKYDGSVLYSNNNLMSRENVLERLLDRAQDDIVVSTTGKTSREIYEIRERCEQSHSHDFLTVGSMGHASSIAFGIAKSKPEKRVWCIDGDGAAIMHMGAIAIIGTSKQQNLIHVVINNEAHESVGGMPTVAGNIDLCEIARACGYPVVCKAKNFNELDAMLEDIRNANVLCFMEVACAIGSREDLGRPTTTPIENRDAFMEFVSK